MTHRPQPPSSEKQQIEKELSKLATKRDVIRIVREMERRRAPWYVKLWRKLRRK